jgi:coenzyme F420-dependent glucose-6-phosphate dehydrogenase
MSVRFVLQVSMEQFPPEDLLRQAVAGERAGFDGITASDHLQPWWEPGESGHTWPWLGAAGASTERVLLGTGITPPGRRYHPALIAQAWMTLERLFPGRIFLGTGSGEALNEVPVGDDWPSVHDQIERMAEALGFIRRLWDGETITERGRFFTLTDCKLHTLAERKPPIWVSAFGPEAARVAAEHGDGVWTLADPENAPKVIQAYREACEQLGREPGEIVLQALFSHAADEEAALEGARVWKGAQPLEFYRDDWHIPREMYEEGKRQLSDEDLREKAIISADPAEHVRRIEEILAMGPTVVVLQNNSGADPHAAIDVYGEQVLPRLRQRVQA